MTVLIYSKAVRVEISFSLRGLIFAKHKTQFKAIGLTVTRYWVKDDLTSINDA
jgi:hypothetical protein